MKKIFSLIIATILFASFALINNNSLYASENANESVAINFEIFPDKNFQDYILHYIDIDNNGALEQSEIQNVQTIDISECEISDLTGILMFTNLKRLDCSYNKIKEVPQLPKSINELICRNNCLVGELDVSGYTNLYGLNCSNNNLTSVTLNDKCSYEYVILENNHIISESDVKGKNFEWCYIPGDRDVYTFWPQRIDEYLYFDGISGTITYCEKDATNIVIPEKIKGIEVVAIGERSFANCKKLTRISLPASVTSIGEYAFEGCTALSTLEIEGALKSIGHEAFIDCDSLEFVSILLDNAILGRRLFKANESLIEVDFSGNVASFDNGAFRDCKNLKKVTLPDGMTKIGKKEDGGFFQNCESLVTVTIPESVTLIGDNTFNGCTSLVSVNIPSGVSYIGRNAFHWCSSLESIVIPSGVSIINYGTFEGCSKLSTVFLPEGIIQVCDSAFEKCESLESITLPSSLEIIEDFAFSGCEKIEEYVLGKNVKFIGDYVFQFNWNLNRIYVAPDNKYFSSVDGILFNKDKSNLIKYPPAKEGKAYSVLENVINISDHAFQSSKIEQVHLPNGLQTIGNHAFQNTALHSVKLPDTVICIGIRAFDCWDLNRIYIPANVNSIGEDAFKDCESVTIYGESESYAEAYALQNNIPFIAGQMPEYKDIDGCSVTISPLEYQGENKYPQITIIDGEKILVEGIDYEFTTPILNSPGKRFFYVQGKGDYYGEKKVNYIIEPPDYTNLDEFSESLWAMIYHDLAFASVFQNKVFSEKDPVPPLFAFYWLKLSATLLPNELSLDDYLSLHQKYFLNYDEDTIIQYLNFMGWYDETRKWITIGGHGGGGDIAFVKLNHFKVGDTYYLQGLYVTELAKSDSISTDKKEFYDYFVIPYGESGYRKGKIARSIEFTFKKTSEGYKIASYKILPYYDYDGTRYYYNEEDDRFYPGTKPSPTPTPSQCNHDWKNATCITPKTCSLCGTTEGSALGHRTILLPAKAATCTTAGLAVGEKCAVCDTVTKPQSKVVALGHQAGSAKVTVKATATKDGKIETKCTVCSTVLDIATIKKASKVTLSAASYAYNGKVKSPKVVVKDSAGKTISAKYYAVTKPSGRKAIGKYTYIVKFKGKYSGTKKLTLTIKPVKPTIQTPKAAKKAITVKWKKSSKSQVTGYEVMVATNSKFSKNKKTATVKGYSKTSYKLTKLKAKTKYYVKVRTYKTVKGVKIYSDWSKVKTVRTK